MKWIIYYIMSEVSDEVGEVDGVVNERNVVERDRPLISRLLLSRATCYSETEEKRVTGIGLSYFSCVVSGDRFRVFQPKFHSPSKLKLFNSIEVTLVTIPHITILSRIPPTKTEHIPVSPSYLHPTSRL